MNSNNQMIQKGKISSVEGKADRNGDKTTARVLPSTADSMVTRPLTIPWYLRGEMGNLTPGTEVAYAMFEDGTGIILSRMDGEWDGIVPGDITVKKRILSPSWGENLTGAFRVDVVKPTYKALDDTQVAKFSGHLTVSHKVESEVV